jgi:PRD1 phage membrane DNA delivery
MGDRLIESLTTVAVAIVGIAIIAVLVGQQARTTQVIGAAGQAFAQDIGAAVSPVTGGGGFNGLGGAFNPTNY